MQSCGSEEPSLEEQTLGQFALVSYIADPLAGFLDGLRMELKPGCKPHAHITILPPRPLHSELADAIRKITDGTRGTAPFRVELAEIEIFETSHVVYLGLGSGAEEMRRLYSALNRGCLQYTEPFPYHPHITIAQDLLPEEAAKLSLIAKERWANYKGPRGFMVSVLSFVQHVAPLIWTDVAALSLGVDAPAGVSRASRE